VSTKAINPNAASIRAALKSAGLTEAIRKITTGPKAAYLYVSDSPQTVMGVVKALSPLWNDSAERISHEYGQMVEVKDGLQSVALIKITRVDWHLTTSVEFNQERRARALFGPAFDTEDYPLQYLPRHKGDHEPWATYDGAKIRYSNAEVQEWSPVCDPQVAQDEAEAQNVRELPRRPVAVEVRTEDSERSFRTKPGSHVPGRLLAGKCFRRNRRR
jgi:hypothetical protein